MFGRGLMLYFSNKLPSYLTWDFHEIIIASFSMLAKFLVCSFLIGDLDLFCFLYI